LNDLHANKRFHGDLKPPNIFFDEITRDIITDSDSVTFLDEHNYEGDSNYDNKLYLIKSRYTSGYASKEHI
jgi:serine/threonine protein kinase